MILHNNGSRTVELFIPFDYKGKKVEAITLAPLKLGHVLRWNEGAWKRSIDLLVEMAGVDEAVIRELRYPDADRVMETFLTMLTVEIRGDIDNNRIPIKREPEDVYREDPEPVATNGSGNPIGPGVPLPAFDQNPGFDMSEEP